MHGHITLLGQNIVYKTKAVNFWVTPPKQSLWTFKFQFFDETLESNLNLDLLKKK